MKKVVICVEDSPISEAVCEYGIYMAKLLKKEAIFVHVVENLEIGENFYGLAAGGIVLGENDMLLCQCTELEAQKQEEATKKGKILLQRCCKIAEENGIKAIQILKNGDFIDVMSEYKDDARLFVAGIKGQSEDDIGFNITALIKEFKIPVLLVNKKFDPVNSLLIAFDDTPVSVKTLEFINSTPIFDKFAKRYIVNVNSDKEKSEEILTNARKILTNVNAEFISLQGEAADEIIKFRRTNNIDIVVTGAFSKGFFSKLLYGSVSESIMQNSLVPIFVLA